MTLIVKQKKTYHYTVGESRALNVCDVVSDVVINVMIRFSGRSWGVPSHLQENPTEIVAKLCCVVTK